MKNNPNWWSEDRSLCEWKYWPCDAPRWAPYSWNYCALHFAVAALHTDRERKAQDLPPIAVPWVRDRFCGVLNGYTSNLGDVAWDTNYPREELEHIAREYLNLTISDSHEPQYAAAKAKIAAEYPFQYRELKSRISRTVRRINETGSV